MNLIDFSAHYKDRSERIGKIVRQCQTFLKASFAKEAREYLSSRMAQTSIDEWEVGFFPSRHDLFDSDVFNLGYWYWDRADKEDDHSHHTAVSLLRHHPILFPYKDTFGNYVGLCGRTLLDKAGQSAVNVSKYKYTPDLDKSHFPYGLHLAKGAILKERYVCLVEGQIDAISCRAVGLTNTVAVGGSALSEHQFRQLRMWTDRIVVLFDPDAAGRAGTIKAMQRFGEDCTIHQLQLDSEEDIDTLLSGNKREETLKKIRHLHF